MRLRLDLGASRLITVPIDHSYSQQPKSFSLFKRCKWLVVNRDVVKRTSSCDFARYSGNFRLLFINFLHSCFLYFFFNVEEKKWTYKKFSWKELFISFFWIRFQERINNYYTLLRTSIILNIYLKNYYNVCQHNKFTFKIFF